MMMALNHKVADITQRNYEASIKRLQTEGQPFTLQYNITTAEGPQELPDGPPVDPDFLSNSEPIEHSKECTQHLVYHHDFGPWAASLNSNPVSHCQLDAFQGQFHPFAANYRFQYTPPNMFTQNFTHDNQFQDIEYFVVIDFEATCDREKNPHPQEIIEFPSVIVSSMTGQLEACFQTYVRPTCNQVLSDFCKDLTGIQQIQVDRGVALSEALLRHDIWLEKKGIKNSNFAVVTWSNWDCRVMLESECRYKNIRKPPYFNRWINLRVPFREVFGEVRCNLKQAVETAGLTWQGRAHCGLDDAKNTARLLALIMSKGFKFSITNTLAFPTSDDSFSWKPAQAKPLFISPQSQMLPELQPPVLQYHHYCYCGVTSSKGVVRKPGPKHGSIFLGCGNWTSARGARCNYFEWVSPRTH